MQPHQDGALSAARQLIRSGTALVNALEACLNHEQQAALREQQAELRQAADAVQQLEQLLGSFGIGGGGEACSATCCEHLTQLPQDLLGSIAHLAGKDARLVCSRLRDAYGAPTTSTLREAPFGCEVEAVSRLFTAGQVDELRVAVLRRACQPPPILLMPALRRLDVCWPGYAAQVGCISNDLFDDLPELLSLPQPQTWLEPAATMLQLRRLALAMDAVALNQLWLLGGLPSLRDLGLHVCDVSKLAHCLSLAPVEFDRVDVNWVDLDPARPLLRLAAVTHLTICMVDRPRPISDISLLEAAVGSVLRGAVAVPRLRVLDTLGVVQAGQGSGAWEALAGAELPYLERLVLRSSSCAGRPLADGAHACVAAAMRAALPSRVAVVSSVDTYELGRLRPQPWSMGPCPAGGWKLEELVA